MKWIGYLTDKEYNFQDKKQEYGIPPAYIVRKFELNSFNAVKVRVAALGVYSLYINGQLINHDFMTQDCSEYDGLVYYREYNISKYVKEGTNSLGIILCDGWYSSLLSIVGRNVYGEYPDKVMYQIFVDKELAFESDGSEVAHDGAIRAADNQNGIVIDKNYDLGDFSSPDYDLSSWHKVDIFDINIPKIRKSIINPVVAQKRFKPKLVKEFDNHHIFDFGQNMTGIMHTIFRGHKGDKIIINHGEMLNPDNSLYTENLRSALARDIYILNDDKEVEFLPRHTFHGFRYIDVITEGNVEIVFMEAIAFWTKMKRTGFIKTNNRLVNKLYSNVLWGQRDNSLSIPTDCPQRDERMGWTGDAQIFSSTAMYNYDCEKFYKKYVIDMMTGMDLFEGHVPIFSPMFHKNDGPYHGPFNEWRFDAAGWSNAMIIIPLNLYRYYGDKAFLKRCMSHMKRFLKNEMEHLVGDVYKGHTFGDWLSVFESMNFDIYNMAYMARDNYLMAVACHILNDKDEDKYYQAYEMCKKIFREKYLVDGKLVDDVQGSYVLAYAFNLIDESEFKDNIVRKVKQYNHLTTGFHSTKFLLGSLCEIGRTDLAYKLLNNKKYPSWGYMISCGATTMWERWDSYNKEKGFNDVGMNSFNHYSLGSVVEWMYKDMCGISPCIDVPAFKKTLVSPYFDKSVSKLSMKFATKHGKISVNYQILNNIVDYHIKANPRIRLEFAFNNEIISQEEIDKNEFIFKVRL